MSTISVTRLRNAAALKGSGPCEEITVLRDFGGRPDVAFGLHADVLDRWSKEGDMLRQAYRPILCVLSVLIAALIVGASGGLQPAHRLFSAIREGCAGDVRNPVHCSHDCFFSIQDYGMSIWMISNRWRSRLLDR